MLSTSSPPATTIITQLYSGVTSCLEGIIGAPNSTEEDALKYIQYVEDKMIPEHAEFHCFLSIESIVDRRILKLAYMKDWPKLIAKCEEHGSSLKSITQEDFAEIIGVSQKPLIKIFNELIQKLMPAEFLLFCHQAGLIKAFPALRSLFWQKGITLSAKITKIFLEERDTEKVSNLMQSALDIYKIQETGYSFICEMMFKTNLYMLGEQKKIFLPLVIQYQIRSLIKPILDPRTQEPFYLIDFALVSGSWLLIKALMDLPFPFEFKARFLALIDDRQDDYGHHHYKIKQKFSVLHSLKPYHLIEYRFIEYIDFLESIDAMRKIDSSKKQDLLNDSKDDEEELKSFGQASTAEDNTFYIAAAEFLYAKQNFSNPQSIQNILKKIFQSEFSEPSNRLQFTIVSELLIELMLDQKPSTLHRDLQHLLIKKVSKLKEKRFIERPNQKTYPWDTSLSKDTPTFYASPDIYLDGNFLISLCQVLKKDDFFEDCFLYCTSKDKDIPFILEFISKIPKRDLAETLLRNPKSFKSLYEMKDAARKEAMIAALLQVAPFTQLQRFKKSHPEYKSEYQCDYGQADLFDYENYIQERNQGKDNKRKLVRNQYYGEIIEYFKLIYEGKMQDIKALNLKISEAIQKTSALSLGPFRLESETNADILRGLKMSILYFANTDEEQIKNIQRMYADFAGLPYVHNLAVANTSTPSMQNS